MNKDILLSMDWDHVSMYPELQGEQKKAYAEAAEWSLEFLAREKLTITFFCCPEDAAMFPGHLRMMKEAGHQIGLHIHTIDKNTSLNDKQRIITDGKKMLEDSTQQTVQWFRGGMFYVDQDIANILKELEFVGDSSLVPDRRVEKWVSGKYETKYMEFEMPMDYRGFPDTPYYLMPALLEVPPSRYCFNFFHPADMIREIENDPTGLSVIYIHPKNLDGTILKESMEGKMKQGFIEVIDFLKRHNYTFIGYDAVSKMRSFPERFDLYEKLYRVKMGLTAGEKYTQ